MIGRVWHILEQPRPYPVVSNVSGRGGGGFAQLLMDADPLYPSIQIQGRPPSLDSDSPTGYRMTHKCKNITLAQISFAGGKYVNL